MDIIGLYIVVMMLHWYTYKNIFCYVFLTSKKTQAVEKESKHTVDGMAEHEKLKGLFLFKPVTIKQIV